MFNHGAVLLHATHNEFPAVLKVPLLTDNKHNSMWARFCKYQEGPTAGVPLLHGDWKINSISCDLIFLAITPTPLHVIQWSGLLVM